MKKAYLAKYGEIGIKGKNRFIFENSLVDHIRYRLKKIGQFKVSKEQGRIFIEPLQEILEEDVINVLTKIFGIIGVSPVYVLEDSSFEVIQSACKAYIRQEYEEANFTFKVGARRAFKTYPMNSLEISCAIGETLLDEFENLRVDVHNPEVMLWVEIRNNTYVYSKTIKGVGGMPVGTNGKAMLMLSGGIDSPVAGYMISKRGVYIDAVYFHSHPYTTERAKEKVIDLAKILSIYTGKIHLHVVPFTEIQLYIYEKCPHDQLTIIMRRIMMRISQIHAKTQEAQALITGESIGQVASQTMMGLAATDAVAEIPVFRPLIGFDKQEIVEIAQKIGTFETSILPYEDCCTIFVAKHPVTKPAIKFIEKSEQHLVEIEAMIERAVTDTEVIVIRPE